MSSEASQESSLTFCSFSDKLVYHMEDSLEHVRVCKDGTRGIVVNGHKLSV